MKIRIGIPYVGTMSADCSKMLGELSGHPLKSMFEVKEIGVPTIHKARNKLVYDQSLDKWAMNDYKDGWKPEYDYFFSADDDNYTNIDAIIRMIKLAKDNNNRCLVSAAYCGRCENTTHKVVAGFVPATQDFTSNHMITIEDYHKLTLPCDVAWFGMGACIIPSEVINELSPPLFKHRIIKNKDGYWYDPPEDQGLCADCMEAKIPLILSQEVATHRGLSICHKSKIGVKCSI